jgi:cytochrome P450
MSLAGPPPPSHNPARRLFSDMRHEWRAPAPFPPGETNLSLMRTRRMAFDPLPLLLESYERFGPVFTLRIFHQKVIFMLGPAANHYMTVSHAENFQWREGHLGDLIPLLGDGLLTIDGDFHRRSRRIMLPAFHHDRIAEAIDVMAEETAAALAGWHDGLRVNVYGWTRHLAMRIAMRALFGLDPDASTGQLDAAEHFERALSFYSRDYFLQIMRGPGTPFARMLQARRALDAVIHDEIRRRRRTGERGQDILSLLLDATDEEGDRLSDEHVRDEVMTLLFAGHDTTTSTVAFLLYELASHPEELERLQTERDSVLGTRAPSAQELMSGALPQLDMALDETLRLYPPAWIGPRRSVSTFEFEGVTVPAGVPVNYCSWASHHLPGVFADPERFRPQRFSPEARALLPKGAYVPFGGGSRTCIGMRFGQLEIRLIAAMILERFELEIAPGYRMTIRQMPTIGPKHGMPLIMRGRREVGTSALPHAA